jgi:hypothetical protein
MLARSFRGGTRASSQCAKIRLKDVVVFLGGAKILCAIALDFDVHKRDNTILSVDLSYATDSERSLASKASGSFGGNQPM